MDIERLEELKKEVAESNLKVTGVGYLTDLQDLINAEIVRQSVTSEEVAEAINLLKGIQHDKYVIQNYTENDVKNYKLISFAITALQKIGTNTVDVAWTEAYQSYESAGDEAVPYCPKCDADLEDNQKFCKDCGVGLIWPYEWDGYIAEIKENE